MRIFKCNRCGKPIVTDLRISSNDILLQCIHCNYSDFIFNFDKANHQRSKELINNDLSATIKLIEEIVNDVIRNRTIRNYDVGRLVDQICQFSPLITPLNACRLINAVIDNNETLDIKQHNELSFVKYETDKVLIEDIIQENNKCLTYLESRQYTETESSPELLNELDSWRMRYEAVSDELSKLKKDYEELANKYEALSDVL